MTYISNQKNLCFFSFISLKYIELFERILTAGKLRDETGRESKFFKIWGSNHNPSLY